jgi:hypothetical protein
MAAERYRGQGFGKGDDAGGDRGGEGAYGMAGDELRGQTVVSAQCSRTRHAFDEQSDLDVSGVQQCRGRVDYQCTGRRLVDRRRASAN